MVDGIHEVCTVDWCFRASRPANDNSLTQSSGQCRMTIIAGSYFGPADSPSPTHHPQFSLRFQSNTLSLHCRQWTGMRGLSLDVCVADLVFHKRANLTPPFRCIVLVGRIEDGVWDLGGSLSFRVGCPIAYGSATAIPSTGQVHNWCRQQPPRDGMAF